MTEFCHFSKHLLATTPDLLIHQPTQLDWRLLAEKIELAYADLEKYQALAFANCHLYDFEFCGTAYFELFEAVLKRRGTEN